MYFLELSFQLILEQRKKRPIPCDQLMKIQQECFDLDDEARWLIALITDTGARLAENCSLETADINLNTDIPHIDLKRCI